MKKKVDPLIFLFSEIIDKNFLVIVRFLKLENQEYNKNISRNRRIKKIL